MGKLETTLKSEIQRLAKKEIRPLVQPLQKEVRELSRAVNSLTKRLDKLAGQASRLEKQRIEKVAELKPEPEEVSSARISAGLIKKLRKKLGVTQAQLAALVDVSPAAVQSWEQDIARPGGENKAALVALRKLGRRDVQKLMEEKGVSQAGRKPRTEKPRRQASAKKAKKAKKAAKKAKRSKKSKSSS